MPSPVEVPQSRALPMRLPVEIRASEAGKMPTIVGYAAVFYNADDPGTEYRLWSDMYERIKPGAFKRAIAEDDVRALFNHSDSVVLGRKSAGTLRLYEDEKGLRYEIDPPDTQAARDLVESIRRGDISGSSFMFVPLDTTYRDIATESGTITIVERNDVRLYDVGPVTFPAYASADSGLRSARSQNDRDLAEWRAKSAGQRRRVSVAARLAEIACGEG